MLVVMVVTRVETITEMEGGGEMFLTQREKCIVLHLFRPVFSSLAVSRITCAEVQRRDSE